MVDEEAGELVANSLVPSAAATEESTPPESAQMTRSLPTCSRIFETCSSMMLLVDQVGFRPATL